MNRRFSFLALAASACLASSAFAQGFPAKPVRIVSAFSAGSGPDAMLRLVAERLSKAWEQQVIIDNRPGGSGFVAVAEVKKAPADGYTLLHADGLNFTAIPHLYKKAPYEAVDFDPVTPVHRSYFFITVSTNSPWKSVADLVATAKAKPGEVTYGSWQVGSVAHLGGAALEEATGTRMNHIPFKENSQLYTGVANGDVNWAFGTAGSAGPLQRAGKVRFLALAGPQRLAAYPEVPTVAESGGPARFEASGWVGLFAVRGTARATSEKIAADLANALSGADIRARMSEFGYEAVPMSPAQTARLVATESLHYAQVVKRSEISLD